MIAIDLSKQQALDANPNAIQQINFTANFNQPINSNFKTYDNIRKVYTGKGDDYTTGGLLDYIYFKTF